MDDKILLHRFINSLQAVQGNGELLKENLSEEGKRRLKCLEEDAQFIARELRD